MSIDYSNWMFVFLRISGFLLMLPFFSAANFPVTMRVAIGAIASLLIAPLLPAFSLSHLGFLSTLGVMIQEVTVGVILGYFARLLFFAVDLAGTVIGTEMGLNMASILNPGTQQNEQVPSTILFLLATVVMLTLNLHHWMLLGFQQTYTVLPIGGAHLNGGLFQMVISQVGRVFVVALQISAPVMAVSFVITVIFAVLSRAVPQMNVFAEMFGFRIIGGLVVFGFTLQITAQHVSNFLNKLPDDLLTVAQLLGGAK